MYGEPPETVKCRGREGLGGVGTGLRHECQFPSRASRSVAEATCPGPVWDVGSGSGWEVGDPNWKLLGETEGEGASDNRL